MKNAIKVAAIAAAIIVTTTASTPVPNDGLNRLGPCGISDQTVGGGWELARTLELCQ
jgi:hypothetical protein